MSLTTSELRSVEQLPTLISTALRTVQLLLLMHEKGKAELASPAKLFELHQCCNFKQLVHGAKPPRQENVCCLV